eukprot:6476151-Amphidinium_carterae.1
MSIGQTSTITYSDWAHPELLALPLWSENELATAALDMTITSESISKCPAISEDSVLLSACCCRTRQNPLKN